MCAYKGVRNVRFSENLACFVFLLPPFWDSPFCLIANDLLCFLIETRKDLDANLLMYINEHFLFAVYKYYLEIVCEIFIFMDVVTLPSFCMEDNWK